MQFYTNDTLKINTKTIATISTSLSTSLGPRGMDKLLIQQSKTTITNDGATILKKLSAHSPILQVLSHLAQAQDAQCGDGTTSAVLLCSALMQSINSMPPRQAEGALRRARQAALAYLQQQAQPVGPDPTGSVVTCLGSKVVSSYAQAFARIAVDAVARAGSVDDVRVVKKIGGGLEDIRMVEGIAISNFVKNAEKFGEKCGEKGDEIVVVNRDCNAAIIQFCLSAPKPDIDAKVQIRDAGLMQQLLEQEKEYILSMCSKIRDAGVDLLIVQKSILREAVSELALRFLTKMGIMVISDVDRKEVELLAKMLEMEVVSDISLIKVGGRVRVREVESYGSRITTIGRSGGLEEEVNNLRVRKSKSTEGVNKSTEGGHESGVDDTEDGVNPSNEKKNRATSVIIRGGDKLLLDEAERALHDALCVAKALIDRPYMVPGGGTMEMGIANMLRSLDGSAAEKICFQEIGKAFEAIPFYLARNAGLDAVAVLEQLRRSEGLGVSVKQMGVGRMADEGVVQPLLVSECVVGGAIDTALMIMKIDDILPAKK